MKSLYLFFPLIAFFLTLIIGILLFVPSVVFGTHDVDLSGYEIHPDYREDYPLHVLHIIPVWIQVEEDYIPFESKCAIGYSLTVDGRCSKYN